MKHTRSIAIPLLTLALALPGCGSGTVTDAEPVATDPATAAQEPTDTAGEPSAAAGDPAERSAELCAQMRERLGSLPSPEGDGSTADFEQEVETIQSEYLEGISQLQVPEEDRDTLERLLIAQRELFEAQAAARAAPGEGSEGDEGPAADATAEVEQLASEIGITGCAAI